MKICLRPFSTFNLRSSLLLIATILAGCDKQTPATSEPPGPRISSNQIIFQSNAPQLSYLTIEPAQENEAAAIELYGRLAWDDDVTVRVFSPVAGRVVKIPVEVNQSVSNGVALAVLDSPDFGQARSDARTAEGNFAVADKAFSRAKELLAHGAAAQKDVEAAEAAFVAAQAEKERAEAKLANFGGSLENTNGLCVLRSPLAGVVVEKNITPGQEIRPDLMLANAPQFTNPQFVVTDPARLWLFLDVDEATAASLAPGWEIFIHSKAYPDKLFHGQLEIIGRELDPATRTLKARCRVDNAEKLLRAEMYVTADVTASGAAVVSVPTKAVFLKDNEHFVFVETAPGQFMRRAVKLGAEHDGRTVIADGVQSGQRIVADGCLLLESIFEGNNS